MKKIKVDDKTKIQILKGTTLLSAGAAVVTSIGAQYILNQYEKLQRRSRLAGRILERFVELAPEAVSEQVMREFEFEWLVRDLNMPEFPKEK